MDSMPLSQEPSNLGTPAGLASLRLPAARPTLPAPRGTRTRHTGARPGATVPAHDAMKLIFWNVNGLRSVLRKGFLDFPACPNQNVGNHGFTPEERAGFAALIEAGFVDTFHEFEKGGGHYTYT